MNLIIIGIIIGVIWYILKNIKFCFVECKSSVCLVGKVALVTGGSSGIGYEIVLSLASRGCKVIIADKTIDESIKKSIIDETDNTNIVLEYVDFTSFKSIRNFTKKLNDSEDKLDILINNVGIGKGPEELTEDGLNSTMQINHYGPFLLTYLLIDLLKKSSSSRIIFTSSFASFFHNITPKSVTSDNIEMPRYRFLDYANAKFLTIVSSDIFAKKLKKFNITCNTYHPGIVNSNFFLTTRKHLNYFSFTDLYAYAHIHFAKVMVQISPRKAAQTALNLALSKEFKNTTGIFFGKYLRNLKPKLANDEQFCYKLWKASEKIVQLKPEEILQ